MAVVQTGDAIARRARARAPASAAHGRRASRLAATLAFLALGLTACGTPSALRAYDPDELRAELRRRMPDVADADLVVPWEVSEATVRRARELTRSLRPSERVRALIDALSSPQGFGLRYTWAVSNSAALTLEAGGGTCMGLSSLLVGLSRELGVDAYYVDASRVLERHEEAEVKVVAGHIAAVVFTEQGGQVVDFTGELMRGYRYRRITDIEATAHYYNNVGYELIHLAEREKRPVPWPEVSRQFARATRVAPGFARAWNNLGVASVRMGQFERAERSYNQALRLEPGLESPRINLAALATRAAPVLSLGEEPSQPTEAAPLVPRVSVGAEVKTEEPIEPPPTDPALP